MLVVAGCTKSPSTPPEEQLVKFERDMTAPTMDMNVLMADLPPEVRASMPSGFWMAKCEVLSTGVVRNCVETKSQGTIGPSLLKAMEAHRATPATKNGQPVSTVFIFTFRLHP